MDKWIKCGVIHGLLLSSAIKKNDILTCATTWMDLDSIMLSEIRQRRMSHDFTHTQNVKKKKKNKVKQNLTDTDNRLVRERELGVSVKWVKGLKCMVMDGN